MEIVLLKKYYSKSSGANCIFLERGRSVCFLSYISKSFFGTKEPYFQESTVHQPRETSGQF